VTVAIQFRCDDDEHVWLGNALEGQPCVCGQRRWTITSGLGLPIRTMQAINLARKERWHDGGSREWSVLEWAGAMCGEAGEAANVAKKLLRIDLGLRGNEVAEHVIVEREALRAKLASEIGGVVLYCALLASHAGIDLESAIITTFNAKSDALGFPEKL
jgi:NTP pyrophosphatase (non-canonical NTP hydrolase)